jgi:hypothetical protein
VGVRETRWSVMVGLAPDMVCAAGLTSTPLGCHWCVTERLVTHSGRLDPRGTSGTR